MEYEPVIGLEVHLQLATRTKAFCGCNNAFGNPPNSQTCPVCLGFPGSLPVLNKEALKLALKSALALNCKIRDVLKFDRKHYYYPDLPKNFQISQYDMPLSYAGFLDIAFGGLKKRINIRRIHLEEDAGKLVHPEGSDFSLVDYNRAGVPLLEIVSEPDMNFPDEAYAYLSLLKMVLEYCDVSSCDMEKGTLRCDANLSLRPKGTKGLGVKVEVKNMNSFKAVRAALSYEIERQNRALSSNERIPQETRLWDDAKGITASLRSKEEAHDYRYFPEPDLVPFSVPEEEVEAARRMIPELPYAKEARFISQYNLSAYDAQILTQDKGVSLFFEECIKYLNDPKEVSNWIAKELQSQLNLRKKVVSELGLKPASLCELIKMVQDGSLSRLRAKDVLSEMIDKGTSARSVVDSKGISQVSDEGELEALADSVIAENEKAVSDYASGKEGAVAFLVGQLMKKSKGRANPKLTGDVLRRKLGGKK